MHGITALDQLMAVMSDRPIRNTSAYFVKICTKYEIKPIVNREHTRLNPFVLLQRVQVSKLVRKRE